MTAPDVTIDPELESVAWDLSHLLNGGAEDPGAAVDRMLASAQQRADALAEAHAGKVAELNASVGTVLTVLGTRTPSGPRAP